MPMKNIAPTSRSLPSRKIPNEIAQGATIVTKTTTQPAIITTVFQRGGGIGKTTISSLLATHFALSGYATLYVEVDEYARAYLRLIGTTKRNSPPLPNDKTSYALFHPSEFVIRNATFQIDLNETLNRSSLPKETIARIKAERGWNNASTLDVIPGTTNLRSLDREFALAERDAQLEADLFDPNNQLRQSLEYFRGVYDRIVIDTPAGLNTLTWNALVACDYAIMPIAFDVGSIEDYDESYRTLEQVISICQRRKMPAPVFLGYVGNFFNPTSSLDKAVFQSYIGPHPDPDSGVMTPAAIPYPMLGCLPLDTDKTIGGAWAKHMTVHTFAPQSELGKAAFDFCTTVANSIRK